MIKVPSGRLKWEEELDIRKAALQAAVRYSADRSHMSPSAVVIVAKTFEIYLIEGE